MTGGNVAKKKPDNVALRQEAYHNQALAKGNAMERLRDAWMGVYQLQSALAAEDPARLKTDIEAPDIDLLLYAISTLRTNLTAVAIRDVSLMATESILDTTSGKAAAERWEGWLMAAPCWPELAKENWQEAINQASDLVVARLGDAGIVLDAQSVRDVKRMVCELQLSDVLPAALLERFFPADDVVEAEAPEPEGGG